ncbi:MAG: glycosyltransferase family A protein [Pseudomonadota bacterium]
MISVSTIIPVFNDQRSAEIALRSVFAQTRPSDEIIVVDDGSDPAFVLPDAAPAHNIRVLRQPNGGPAAARNAGIDAATGTHIAFLDSDDVWLEQKLEKQLAFFSTLPDSDLRTTICATGFILSSRYASPNRGSRRALIPIEARDAITFAMGCWYCPGSTMMAHASLFHAVGRYDETLRRYEDYEFGLRLARFGGRMAVCPELLSAIHPRVRQHERSPEPSVSQIRAAHCEALAKLTPKAAANLDAFLELECAASARRRGRYSDFAAHLLRSLAHRPRLHAQVGRFWSKSDG